MEDYFLKDVGRMDRLLDLCRSDSVDFNWVAYDICDLEEMYELPFCQGSKQPYVKAGEECPICLEQILTPRNALLTPCYHKFHKDCFRQHVIATGVYKTVCPVCRGDVGFLDFCGVQVEDFTSYSRAITLEDIGLFVPSFGPYTCLTCEGYIGFGKKDCKRCSEFMNGYPGRKRPPRLVC